MVRARGTGKHKELLSQSEKEAMLSDKKELQETIRDRSQYGIGTAADQIDQAVIKKQIDRIDRAIADREPPKLRGADKDSMAKEAEEIEQELREGMPTKNEMDHPGSNPGAVRKHMNWDKRNQEKIERYRYIQRCLNPEDPRSIENLRKEK